MINSLILNLDLLNYRNLISVSNDDIINYIQLSVNKNIDLSSFSFRINIFDNTDRTVFTSSFPYQGVTIISTDQDVLKTFDYRLIPDKLYKIIVEYSFAGRVSISEFAVTAPRPKQPYPSWIWLDGDWVAPVPYPGQGPFYTWNESKKKWSKIKDKTFSIFADKATSDYRYNLCKSCDSFIKLTKQCSECMCIMPIKTKFANDRCPLEKW